MAWTEAARRAAAEARSAHTAYKTQYAGVSKFNLSADTSAERRAELARNIKKLKKANPMHPSGAHSDFTVHSNLSEAAASTRLRNLAKQAHSHSSIHVKKK